MCNFSGRLITWMDGELAENDATEVERHVQACADCRERVAAYKDVSRGFAAYYSATTPAKMAPRRVSRWVGVAVAGAAVVLIAFVMWPRSAEQSPATPVGQAPAPSTVERVAETVVPIQARHATSHNVAAHKKARRAEFEMAEPAIQIAIPGEAMFPPGAVPEGVTYIANVSLAADGSVQGVRLQP